MHSVLVQQLQSVLGVLQKDDAPKATKAHMGKKNEFIYDEKVGLESA